MARKTNAPPIACEFFTWRLFLRDGVYYADGRSSEHDLGKHSLGTRHREQAIAALKKLDFRKAVEFGLTDSVQALTIDSISITDGWNLYLDFSGRSDVQGGVSSGTLKRYRSVRD